MHQHPRTCNKYPNKKNCRFNFGNFFTDRTIIAQPLPVSLSIEQKKEVMQSRKEIQSTVKNCTDTELNPSTSRDLRKIRSVPDTMQLLQITQSD